MNLQVHWKKLENTKTQIAKGPLEFSQNPLET
jgi:hypothetical protein